MNRSVVSKPLSTKQEEFVDYFRDKSPSERLVVACKLINEVCNIIAKKIDKTIVSARKLK